MIFYNRFVELRELTEFLGAADLYVTPYLNQAQITSGTLAYAFGCGKAVISTPYWHAEELLADGRGVLVPFADSEAIAREICALLADEARRHAMRKRAYMLGREMIWSNVAHLYMDTFEQARRSLVDKPGRHYVGAHARGAHARPARAAVGPSVEHDRLHRDFSARQLYDSEFRARILHRRQCPGADPDRAA